MNSAIKAAIFHQHAHFFHLRAALFHSTPVLERKRRSYWQSPRSHQHSYAPSKRFRKMQSKRTLLRDISSYADYLFQSWREEHDEDDPSKSRGPSWFKRQYSGRSKKAQNQGNKYWNRRAFQFCEDEDGIDVDVERIFGSVFGRNRCFCWSFIDEENSKWRRTSNYDNNHSNFGSWRARVDEDYESSNESESETIDSDMASDRRALGLTTYGPLKLEDVKNAYRACALKWHPDRHQGSSKVVAEEKFKLCSQAYQSICDKLAVN